MKIKLLIRSSLVCKLLQFLTLNTGHPFCRLDDEQAELSPPQITGNDGPSQFLLAQGTVFPFGSQFCIFIDLDTRTGYLKEQTRHV